MYAKHTVFLFSVSAALLFSAAISQAEPVSCKGMEQSSCTQSTSCRWVNSYQRIDGREVKGYCRKLPGKTVQGETNSGGTGVRNPEKS